MSKSQRSPAPTRSHLQRARRAALQALYQWQLTELSPQQITEQFIESGRCENLNAALFSSLLHGIVEHHDSLDQILSRWVDRPMKQVDPVERAILRMAVYELSHCPLVPVRVVINEAINLAHTFGAEQSHRYVNGVIDKAAHALRPNEFDH